MFTPIWGRFPFWLIFFRWVETTNQWPHWPLFKGHGPFKRFTLTEPGLPLPRDGSNTLIFRPFRVARVWCGGDVVEKFCFCRLVVVLMIELRYSRYDLFVIYNYIFLHFIPTKLDSAESKCLCKFIIAWNVWARNLLRITEPPTWTRLKQNLGPIEPRKKTSYFPLHWLLNRDRYNIYD